jgi:hypothetical protein
MIILVIVYADDNEDDDVKRAECAVDQIEPVGLT